MIVDSGVAKAPDSHMPTAMIAPTVLTWVKRRCHLRSPLSAELSRLTLTRNSLEAIVGVFLYRRFGLASSLFLTRHHRQSQLLLLLRIFLGVEVATTTRHRRTSWGWINCTYTWAELPASHHNSPLAACPPAFPRGKGNSLGFASRVVRKWDGWPESFSCTRLTQAVHAYSRIRRLNREDRNSPSRSAFSLLYPAGSAARRSRAARPSCSFDRDTSSSTITGLGGQIVH